MNYKEKLGASENPFTSQISTLEDREDKLDALENPENHSLVQILLGERGKKILVLQTPSISSQIK